MALSPEALKSMWNCMIPPHLAACDYLLLFVNTPPYLAPEDELKVIFQLYFGDAWEDAYDAWWNTSAMQRRTVTIGGIEVTGVRCDVGLAPLVRQCQLIGGCGSSDQCDCVEWWWRNKPLNPCIGLLSTP